MIDGPYDKAFLLAGGTAYELAPGTRTDLVRLANGRIGYLTATSFRPIGDDDDLEQITLNTGDERGTSVLSLVFADGEVRETVAESGAAVSKRLRADGYIVSAQQLGPPRPPPPERAVERRGEAAQEPAPTAPLARERVAPQPPAAAPASSAPAVPFRERAAGLVRPALSLLRLAVLIVGGVVVAILVINVLLLLANANQENGLVTFFRHASKTLAWEFKDVFEPRTTKAIITENYLLAAAVYLAVTLGIARVLLRLRGANPVRRP